MLMKHELLYPCGKVCKISRKMYNFILLYFLYEWLSVEKLRFGLNFLFEPLKVGYNLFHVII